MGPPYPSIADLRRDHQILAAILGQIRCDVRSYPRVRYKIPLLYEQLVDHLRLQDDRFFDGLRKEYDTDRDVLKTIEFLVYELREVKVAAVTFMEKYEGAFGEVISRQFPKDFTDFANIIEGRLRMETEYLFPLLARAQDG